MKEFMTYSDYLNLNQSYTVPVNVSKVLELAQPATEGVAGVATATVAAVFDNVQETVVDIAEQTDDFIKEFTEILQKSPLSGLSDIIAWDALEVLFNTTGLADFVDL